MRKLVSIFMAVALLLVFNLQSANACTNFLISKGASKDGSTMITYAADSHVLYGELYYWPAMDHPEGSMVSIYNWDEGFFLGKIPQVKHTYRVIGNMNEHQLAIAETTWGGRKEFRDSTAIIDYGSLIYLTLQRAKNAREAIRTFHNLVSQFGYASSGESFSICDPNEVWILELIGKQHGEKGAVWVARRIPDGYVSGHANHARITTFPKANKKTSITSKYVNNDKYMFRPELECVYATDVIDYAVEKGIAPKKIKHDEFSFSDTYGPVDFGGARFCEARVYAGFNRITEGFEKYEDYAMGTNLKNRMPLWVKPEQKLGVRDVMEIMRDYYQNTPMDMTKDPGAGAYGSTVRWRPLYWEVDGKKYFNERAISTQQTAFSFVAQSRSWLPNANGGILWFGVDDTYLTVYTPMFMGMQESPENFKVGNGDLMTYHPKSAFWLFNQVSNWAYHNMKLMYPDIRKAQDELELGFIDAVAKVDEQVKNNPAQADAIVTKFSLEAAAKTFNTWRDLQGFLTVKFTDGNIKTKANKKGVYGGQPFTNEYIRPELKQPGYSKDFYKSIVKETGNKFEVKEEAAH